VPRDPWGTNNGPIHGNPLGRNGFRVVGGQPRAAHGGDLRTRPRCVAVAIALVCGISATSLLADAAARPRNSAGAQTVLRNCYDHGGEITQRFGLADLRTALRQLPDDARMYSGCPLGIRSAIAALTGPLGKNSMSAIFSDCADGRGLLSSYSLANLRHARRNLPGDVRLYTHCETAIGSQIHTLTGR
jgi:hypothetical protein